MPCIPDADIDRVPRIAWSCRQFERGIAAGCPGELKEPLLHGQVPGIDRLARLAQWSAERDGKGSAERHPEGYPAVQRQSRAKASFDLADSRLIDPNEVAERSLEQAKLLPPHP